MLLHRVVILIILLNIVALALPLRPLIPLCSRYHLMHGITLDTPVYKVVHLTVCKIILTISHAAHGAVFVT